MRGSEKLHIEENVAAVEAARERTRERMRPQTEETARKREKRAS